MRRLIGLSGLLFLAACGPGRDSQQGLTATADPVIGFHVVHEQPSEQLEAVEYDGDTLYLAPDPLMSDRDFQSVEAFLPGSGELRFDIVLKPEVVGRIASDTEDAIGRRLALLIDGEVRMAPVIRSEIGPRMGGDIQVSEEEGRRLAEVIRDRWPQPF